MGSAVSTTLERFHPLVATWFAERVGEPTEIQVKAWERIAAGEHCLITAATGSGKTLAAFLWAINQLVTGEWGLGQTRVLYISPLKALNNDIQRNLLTPLAELEERFRAAGLAWPEIRVRTRSGDTDQSDRRKMLRRPPEILITTPESLNLLLTSKDGQRSLLGVRSVVLDEIHSVVSSKRGVYLMTAVERLAHLTGEFQRVALSATVRPIDTIAAYVGGRIRGKARSVSLAESAVVKRYEIEVRYPDETNVDAPDEDFWRPIVQDLKRVIEANRSTLVFVNSRMLCEKITHKLNLEEPAPLAYSHHGSLSKEIRTAVEQRLKRGELKAIVATNSLEMGIDIGALDCVVMVQSPNSVSSAIQKVGRAGHQVGAASRAVVYPSHPRDFLESAALAEAIGLRDIEPTRPVERPLDVLAQVIVSTLGTGPWDLDELFELLRNSYPYRDLPREQFDLVVNMLAGRYAGSRLRELKPRLAINRSANTATLRRGALMAYYFSGGVIPDRGYFHMRLVGSGGKIGELDEEFVWERKLGDVFTLGAQSWKIERITYNDVFVVPAESGAMAPPFWRSETYNRDFHFSRRIADFLDWANERVEGKGFVAELQRRFSLQQPAAEALRDFLRKQKLVTGRDLPHRHHLLAEIIDAAPGGAPGQQLVLHTQWGGRVNRPYALALDAAWFETFGHRTEIYVNNDCVVAMLNDEVTAEEALRLVTASNVESWLRQRLEGSGFFGARFREAAGTSLLITRNRAGQRLPLWLSRMRAKKLFESVQRYDDFPLLLEAWRTCLKDEFDMDGLQQVLVELEQGEIQISVTHGAVASPFASSVAWRQINDEYMYATDDPKSGGKSGLREDLVRAVAFDDAARPRIPVEVARQFEAKRQRLEAGYEPSDALELREWLRDRVALQAAEWKGLHERVGEEVSVAWRRVGAVDWACLAEEQERVDALFAGEESAVVEWLSFFGPVSIERMREELGLGVEASIALVDTLVDERLVVAGPLLEGSEVFCVCEADNYESLLRLNRARNRPQFAALPPDYLVLFLAKWQGLVGKVAEGDVGQALERMVGLAAPVGEWEDALLPSRMPGYQGAWLDALLAEEGLVWYGAGEGRVGFCGEDDLDLVGREGEPAEAGTPTGRGDVEAQLGEGKVWEVLRESGARYSFARLVSLTDLPQAEVEAALWGLVWRGWVSNDAFAAARRGAAGKFRILDTKESAPWRSASSLRTRRVRAAPTASYPGAWYALPERGMGEEEDAVGRLELAKERARCVLDRYGVVFRELLQREQPGFRWGDVFKALRLLELAGEVIGGRFFEGAEGLQFASKEAFRALRQELPRKAIYWLAATDPASVCGLGLSGLVKVLPKRLAATRLVYRGSELAMEIQRGGKSLVFHVAPEDADLPEILGALEILLRQGGRAVGQLRVEEINGMDARSSPYLESLDARFRMHCDHKRVVIEGV